MKTPSLARREFRSFSTEDAKDASSWLESPATPTAPLVVESRKLHIFKRPEFVRPKRNAGQTAFAKSLYTLLQKPPRAKAQHGERYGRQMRISCNEFEDHLFGGMVLAIACVSEGRAYFLLFDCDQDFPARLPIYAKVLGRRGLSQASFVTTGSTPGRGKVVVTLAQRLPHGFAVALTRDIQREITADEAFGDVKPGSLTCFPTAQSGGCCRILGRKYTDPAPFERFGNLDGCRLWDLSSIVPAIIEVPIPQALATHGRQGRELSHWAQTVLSLPFTGSEPELLRIQLRLANEAIHLHYDEADARFSEWMEVIAGNSPGLSASVHRQLFRADVFLNAKAYIARTPRLKTWEPFRQPYIPGELIRLPNAPKGGEANGIYKVANGAWRIYKALAGYAIAAHLDPHCFAMDYGRVADLAGYAAKGTAYRAVIEAERAGLLLRLDSGTPRESGRRGRCTAFCLRGDGEQLEDAADVGRRKLDRLSFRSVGSRES